MNKLTLQVTPRQITGRAVKRLRSQGLIPGNVFGKKVTSQNFQVDAKNFQRLHREVGESTLFYLEISDSKASLPVFISQVTRHPVSGQILHVAFHQVDLKEKITAPVKIQLEGIAPAEKDKLGILVQQTDTVDISALPADMPEHIAVDISPLFEVGSLITVGDLKLSSKLEVKSDPQSVITKIEPLAKEEKEEKPLPAEAPAEAGVAPVPEEGTPPSEKPAPAAENKAEKK